MNSTAGVRLMVPKPVSGELIRRELLDDIFLSPKRIVYIQAGAGYGKTTLLSQIAGKYKYTAWISLDGENEIFSFISLFREAITIVYTDFSFSFSEYLPFEGKDNFIKILSNALLNSLEKLPDNFAVILDDLHTIKEPRTKELIAYIMKYLPENIRLFLSSREALWPELAALRAKDRILEYTQNEMKFTEEEAERYTGSHNVSLYKRTEGWPLAIVSFKVLLQSGISPSGIPAYSHDTLYGYLLHECILHLEPEKVDFLKKTACFDDLDTPMLNSVLGIKNAGQILESLTSENIFTIRTGINHFRYHALFREYINEKMPASQNRQLSEKAGEYYFEKQDYSVAAGYAIISGNNELLQKIISTGYRTYLRYGRFNELKSWFQALENVDLSLEMLVAKGAFLSSIGDFSHAKECLDSVLPKLKRSDKDLYIEATLHKARVMRNFVSFEASNRLLDELLSDVSGLSLETIYSIVSEKLYNLCWNSQIKEALGLTCHFIDECAKAGNLKVRAWFERYLTAVYFFVGNMKKTVYYYEKSLVIPEDEQVYLDIHGVGIFAAKAYQYIGRENIAVILMAAELQKLRNAGMFEELWSAYLLAAEIYCENAFIDRINGGNKSFETAIRYYTLADEYAPLYRTTELQRLWAKLLRLANSFYFSEDLHSAAVEEIFENLDKATDYLKTLVLGKLFGHYIFEGDSEKAARYAELSIEIGQRSGTMLIPCTAYGMLALKAIAENDQERAAELTRCSLMLCSENGMYSYFKMKKRYGVLLQFAVEHNIEYDFAKQMMKLAGICEKKLYVETFGGFSVFTCDKDRKPVKMRSKKERELLAFLIDAGSDGATKEQIYEAIWYDSESRNIKKLIDVNLAYIRADLAGFGINVSVVNREKHYSLCMNELSSDIDLFEEARRNFEQHRSMRSAQMILTLYKGEYLSDFEALWAVPRRIKYQNVYEDAVKYCL